MGEIMKRLATFALAVAIANTFAGCQHRIAHSASAVIRYRIFEAPAKLVDEVVPAENRTPLMGSAYTITHGSRADLSALLDGMFADSGLLADASRRISFWPKTADTWTYMRNDSKLLGAGGASGYLGVRSKGRRHEIRIEYDVTHTINAREPIHSKLAYEGAMPDNGVLIALCPFQRTDGAAVVHIIAFEAENWR
jgi:hypothetical protein